MLRWSPAKSSVAPRNSGTKLLHRVALHCIFSVIRVKMTVGQSLECGGKRSATPLSDRLQVGHRPKESQECGVAVVLYHRAPKLRPSGFDGGSQLSPIG